MTFQPLSNLQSAFTTIETAGGSFSVRGLSLEDAVIIYTSNRADIDAMIAFMQTMDPNSEKGAEIMDAGVFETIFKMPGIMAEVIAAAAGSPGPQGAAMVRQIEFPAQILAIKAVLAQTFAKMTTTQFLEMFVSMVEAGKNHATEITNTTQARMEALGSTVQ